MMLVFVPRTLPVDIIMTIQNRSDNGHIFLLIFRLYLLRRKGILSLQETTGDLIPLLKNIGLSDNELSGLRQTLLLSDFVKFAKYQPAATDDQACHDEISKAIQIIERTHQQESVQKEGTGGQS